MEANVVSPVRAPSRVDDHRDALKFLWLEITNRCNLECRHCYAASSPKESATGTMTFDAWCNVMDEARALGCRAIQFIGGEPTLHPQFLQLVQAARQRGFTTIEVYTNATRLTDSLCAGLAALGARVAFSFYAADATIHDQITSRPGSYERTICGVTEALRNGLEMRAGIVITPQNRVAAAEAKRFLEELGVNSIRIDRQRHAGRALGGDRTVCELGDLCGACGHSRLAVSADGRVSPCVFSYRYSIGHIREGLEHLLRKPSLSQFTDRLDEARVTAVCTPSCTPHDCSPVDAECSPVCFPNNCDPEMCDPVSCSPRD